MKADFDRNHVCTELELILVAVDYGLFLYLLWSLIDLIK